MSRRRRQDYIGCSTIQRRKRFFLQARPRDEDGRKRLVRWPTGLSAEGDEAGANRERLQALEKVVGACVKAGRTRTEIDAVLGYAGTSTRSTTTADGARLQVGPTLAAYFAEWIAEREILVDKVLARDYRRHFEGYVLPRLGGLPLAELKPKDIRGLQAELLARRHSRTGEPLKVKTVKNVMVGSFRALWRQAMADELVPRDIFVGLVWPRWEPPEPDPFALEEVRKIEKWFREQRFGFPPIPGSMGIRRLPHPPFHAYVHALFWAGALRPSEASGLQAQDLDLAHGLLHVRRSYHSYAYHPPKTRSARRTIELFPETVRILQGILPLHVTPEAPVFTTTEGNPIEPKTFSEHWYRALRSLGLRVRGLYTTKDTHVSYALQMVGDTEWVVKQTGVRYDTLKKHYAKWMPDAGRSRLRRFAEALKTEREAGEDAEIDVQGINRGTSIPVTAEHLAGNRVRGGGFEPPRVLPH